MDKLDPMMTDINRPLNSPRAAAAIRWLADKSGAPLAMLNRTVQGAFVLFGALMLMAGTALAREWSEEVQMTHAGENDLRGEVRAVVDAQGNINMLYLLAPGTGETLRFRVTYQKFDRFGRALTEPIILGRPDDMPDTVRIWPCDLYCDDDLNIHVLWIDDDFYLYYSMLDSTGEEQIIGQQLEELRHLNDGNTQYPRLALDSQGRIVVFAWRWIDAFTHPPLVYGRYNQDGTLVDSIHTVLDGQIYVTALRIKIDEGDTLHLAWDLHYPQAQVSLCYSRIAPDDTPVIDNLYLEGPAGSENIFGGEEFLIDEEGRLIFVGTHFGEGTEGYIIRYTRDLELDYATKVANHGFGWKEGEMSLSLDGHLHFGFDVDDDSVNNGRQSIAYVELEANGDIVDSLDVLHDRYSAPNGRAAWQKIFSYASDDGQVGVFWVDNRYISGTLTGGEIFLRYSGTNDGVASLGNPTSIETVYFVAYPNPFNETLNLKLRVGIPGNYQIALHDISGRAILAREVYLPAFTTSYLPLEQLRFLIPSLPSGSYTVILGGNGLKESRSIELVK